MIQRIQTVFLFMSAVSIFLCLFSPLVLIGEGIGEAGLFAFAVKDSASGDVLSSNWPLGFLALVVIFISLLSILLYKRRTIQMRLTIYNMLLMVGLIVLGYFYSIHAQNLLGTEIHLGYYSIMPIIGLIFSFLAWRSIRRDDLMLKAVERIR